MKSLPSLTLTRRGTFIINPFCDDTSQCGKVRGQRELHYAVSVGARSDCLDEQGFLIDNSEIHNYFTRTYATCAVFPSCEQIALRAVTDLREIIGRGRCTSVKVQIAPGAHAEIVCEKTFSRIKQ